MATEETKPDVGAAERSEVASDQINLRVTNQDGLEVFFKIKKHTKLQRLMTAYCQRQGVSPSSVRFLYDGERLRAEDTPESLGMEDNDMIDAMVAQTGGY